MVEETKCALMRLTYMFLPYSASTMVLERACKLLLSIHSHKQIKSLTEVNSKQEALFHRLCETICPLSHDRHCPDFTLYAVRLLYYHTFCS